MEGSHSARALVEVATTFNIRDPLFLDEARTRFLTEAELAPRLVMAGPPGDASAFYASIEKARRAYVSIDAIAHLARLAFEEASTEVDGLEMRVSLFSMTRTLLGGGWRDVAPVAFAEKARAVLIALVASRDAAQARCRKPMLLRLGFSRTFESEPHYEALGDMVAEHAPSLCGMDVLGILPTGDREPLQPALVAILKRLLPRLPDLTIHAGEFEDHRSVERALRLDPRGIGHGVHAVGSIPVMATLAERGVTLEVCPSSNALLIPAEMERLRNQHGGLHPLRTLQHHHVHAVLGSDDPVPMGTSFTREWDVAGREGVDLAVLEKDMERRWVQITGAAFPVTSRT
jgi:hypothetical protein